MKSFKHRSFTLTAGIKFPKKNPFVIKNNKDD